MCKLRRMNLGRGAVALLAVAASVASAAVVTSGETNPSVKGSYATQDKLPDWSGVWNPGHPADANKEVPPPYKPEWEKTYRKNLESETRGAAVADPTAGCRWAGVPAIMLDDGYPFEVLFTPRRVTVIHEGNDTKVRRIYTDGRQHPAGLEHTYQGDSIGHWEGDTLVVETVGLRGDTLIYANMPHSDALQVTERWRLTAPDTLEDKITMTDPKAFTKPYELLQINKLRRDWNILEYSCAENNRNPVVDGATGLTGPNGQPLK
jgi:hypothetical protein